ncbi:Histone acetyltransferase HAC12 [Euphorbia peplus]|nr:Histone acetyltransferase HAC12 [Euphorbia peplus]
MFQAFILLCSEIFSGGVHINLMQRNMVDVNRKQLMSSYTGSTCKVMPALTHGCNPDTAYTFIHSNNAIAEHKPLITDYSDQFSFLKGLLNNGSMPVGPGLNTDLQPMRVSYETLLSPERGSATVISERGSTVTSSSNSDGFSEFGAFDKRSLFSKRDYLCNFVSPEKDGFQHQFNQGVASNQNFAAVTFSSTLTEHSEFADPTLQISGHSPQIDSGDCNLLRISVPTSHTFQKKQQPPLYEKFYKPLMDEAPCSGSALSECCSSVAEKMDPMHTHLPPAKLNGVYVVPGRSSHLSSSTIVPAPENSSIQLKISVAQQILCAYNSHKNSTGNHLESFIDHLHLTVCDKQTCMCDRAFPLLLHFDDCCSADCKICGPVREQCNPSKTYQSFEKFYNSVTRDCGSASPRWSGSCSSENMRPPAKRLKLSPDCSERLLPPAKHLKTEKTRSLLSSENSIASELASLAVQPSNLEGLPSLMQFPESPISINSEVLEGGIGVLPKYIQNKSFNQDNSGDYTYRLNSERFSPSKELNNGPEQIDHGICGEFADAVEDKSNELGFNAKDILLKELDIASKEEMPLVRTDLDLAKPDLEAENEKKTTQESPVIRGVSLIEFFSADEIEDHLSSLQRGIGQRNSNEENEKQIPVSVNENTCQLCAADKLLLAPIPIYCSFCGSRIKRNVIYYSTSEENGMRHCFCTSCYKARGRSITFYGITIPKVKMEKKKNVEEIEEPWVQCDKCKSWQHQICALFNDKRDMEGQSQYICPKCCLEEIRNGEYMMLSPKASVFFAKDLPRTLLSDYIEQRLFRRLQQEKEDTANFLGKKLNEVPGAEDLFVRVVLSVNKQLKVKEQFLGIFHNGNYPDGFPYRSKVILLFQKIEGADVCLFGMYVQEFGSECSQPNHRCVYISYLDSVKYFRPERVTSTGEALRTFVYHEILIGYLEYCKKRGFVACYLWACPPVKGEDYILYCHPEIQKTPKSDKLRQWYHSMLRKASKENVVVNFTNLYEHFFVSTGKYYSKVTAARLPYFDGDYWSSAAEITIRNMEKTNGEYSGQKVKKVMTKRTLKSMGHTNFSDDATKDILLMQKLGKTILSVKEDFIVVHLQFVCSYCHEVILSGCRWFCSQCKNLQLCQRCHDSEQDPDQEEDTHTVNSKEKHVLSKVLVDDVRSDTNDEDIILDNWLFENRHVLLGFCQKNHYQFDTLRQAKHSSMMILHYLHHPTMPTSEAKCNFCQLNNSNGNDGNVCASCYSKKLGSSRIHKLAYHSSVTDSETQSPCDEQPSPDEEPNSQYPQKKPFKQMELLNVLEHASQCSATSSDPCSYPNCLKMKRLFYHSSKCKTGVRGGCIPCHKVWYIVKLHVRNCDQIDCCIPRCRVEDTMEGPILFRQLKHPNYRVSGRNCTAS